jgi:hypothetical protein
MNSALLLRHARTRNHCYCPCGALGDSARALSIRAEAYRTVACGECPLTLDQVLRLGQPDMRVRMMPTEAAYSGGRTAID